MIAFDRPRENDVFAHATRTERAAVAVAVANGEHPEFSDKWRAYKVDFAEAQNGKCAYCERRISGHDPHVDHFAPKSEVWERSSDPQDRARETNPPYLPNVRGPRNHRKYKPGYWWLAYDWTNYLVLCSVCNTKWKLCFFPVEARPRRLPPSPNVWEQPSLLNPFDDQAPWRHFRFASIGTIRPRTHRGRETMITCGLDRPTLVHARRELARRAHGLARAFATTNARQNLEDLCSMGHEDRTHAGMVRFIAEQVIGQPWETLLRRLEARSQS